MNPQETRSCSDACLAAGEPLAGTASEAPWFAALAWPKPLWHADKIALSEGLPPGIAELESAAKRAGRKLQLRLFQRAAGAPTERTELLCADFALARSARLADVPLAQAAERIAAFMAGEAVGPPLAAPLVLVCTDGKHDACCGKLGRSLFAALRADGRVDAAEVSHLGGHRLAANCLVLPSGRLYGRVAVADAPELVDAVVRDRVDLPRYRGRSGLSELGQLAEAEVLRRHPGATRIALDPAGDVSFTDGDTVRRLRVRCARRTFLGIGSCGDAEPEARERLVLEGAEAVA